MAESAAELKAALYVPIDEDERKTIREQLRNASAVREQGAWEKFSQLAHAERLIVLDGIKQYGLTTIRLLSILNGGAIIALLGLIGSMFSRGEGSVQVGVSLASSALPAFYFFAGGLVLTASTAGIGYISFNASAVGHISPGHLLTFMRGEVPEELQDYDRLAVGTTWAAILFGVLALAAFVLGCWHVAQAFKVLGA